MEERPCKCPNGLDMEAFKQLIIALSTQSKLVLVDIISDQDFRVVGISEEIDDFLDKLTKRHFKSQKVLQTSYAVWCYEFTCWQWQSR